MKRRVLLKKGTAYLISLGVMQMSAVPTMAQEIVTTESSSEPGNAVETLMESVSSVMEITTENQVAETSEPTVQATESEPTQPQESVPVSVTEETSVPSQESEVPTQEETELTTEQQTSQEQTESAEVSETQPAETAEETTEEVTEESTEELSSEEELTEESLGEGIEEVYYAQAYLSSDAQIYTGWKEDSSAFTSLPSGYPVYVTGVVLFNDEPVWARIMFDVNDYSSEGYIRMDSLQISGEGSIMLLDANEVQSFPADYQSALSALQQAHPNWIFKPIYVGDTFSYAVSQQMDTPARALVSMLYLNEGYRSLLDRDYDLRTNTWKQWEPNWAGASEEAVRYYMDPRNFLNEKDIFMFESLTYESYQNQASVEAALSGSFMANATVPGTDYTYSWLFCWVGEKYNINPVALASRVKQEQGSGTSGLISGKYPGYESLYNYFNIQATGSTRDEIIQNGLKEAKVGSTMMLPDGSVSSGAWNTPEKALIGGSLKFANQYILRNQNTLYAQKFDYDGKYNGKYWHQYMTNISAPYSEGSQVGSSYRATGQLENSFVFLIPVYEERPASSPKPTEHKNQNVYLNSLTVNDKEVIQTFDKNKKDFYYNVGSSTVYANVKVKASATTSSVSFSNVGTMSHKVETTKIKVTAEDGSTAEYRLIIGRGVEIKEGFFDGFDVDAYRKRYPELNKQYGDDLDAYYEHYLLTGKAAGWDGSTDGPFPDDTKKDDGSSNSGNNSNSGSNSNSGNTSNSGNNSSTRPAAMYNGVNYAPVFDAEYYLSKYPDLKAAFGSDKTAALKHFVTYGIKEGRQACAEFNVDIYRSNYADLKKAFGNDNSAYVKHYLEYGQKEGRNAQKLTQSNSDNKSDNKNNSNNNSNNSNNSNNNNTNHVASAQEKKYSGVYDYTYYRNAYADLRAAFGNDADKYFQHFIQCGMAEGRQASASFDVKTYKNNYADLRKAFGNNNVLYYNHYLEYGKAEGRTASSASTVYNGVDYALVYDYEYYKKNYADLRAAFGDAPEKYLQHFIQCGMAEGRQASASFKVSAYKNRYADLRAAFGNNNVAYYLHYMKNGKAEGRTAN